MTREEIFSQLYSSDTVYPPPLESKSALLEITTGCSYRKCKFCDFPKDTFTIFSMSEIARKIELLRLVIDGNPRLHLLGCNPFCLHSRQILSILAMIHDRLSCVKEVSMYARADDILRKTTDELNALAHAGLTDLHIGLESGSNEVLFLHEKGETVEDMEHAMDALDRCGIRYHLTAIPGLGGKSLSREHAVKTAAVISRHNPMSVWCIALKVWPETPLSRMIEEGSFFPLTFEEILEEEREMVSRIDMKLPMLYVDSTVLNQYTIIGMLPDQKEVILRQMDHLLKNGKI
jgi:radical SAM superfamily enzyme YgiQ (UPF0313 family)